MRRNSDHAGTSRRRGRLWILVPALLLLSLAGTTHAEAGSPKVLMLGDSITNHYTPTVMELLKGQADVYRCKENANWTGRLLKELLDGILNEENCKWDIIWFNVGNWDITPPQARFIKKYPGWGFKVGEPKTSLEDYGKNLNELVRRLKAHSPGVKLLFATTTHIPKVGAAQVEKYNAVAVQVMKENGVLVFDLYSLTKSSVDLLLYKNNTHFSKVANEKILGPHVAAALRSFIRDGSLPATHAGDSLEIPKEMIPALEKDRDLGHPKSR